MPLSSFPSTASALKIIDGARGPWGVLKTDDVTIWSTEIEGVPVQAVNFSVDRPPTRDQSQETLVGIYLPCGLEVDWWPAPGVLQFEWYTPIDEDHHMYLIGHAKVVHSPAEEAEFHRRCEQEYIPVTRKAPAGQTDPVGNGPHWGFNNFDAFGREQMHHVYQYEDFWHKERLIRPDLSVVKWRTLVDKRMRGVQKRGDWARTAGWSPDGRDFDQAQLVTGRTRPAIRRLVRESTRHDRKTGVVHRRPVRPAILAGVAGVSRLERRPRRETARRTVQPRVLPVLHQRR
jgi:hypothetical protein